jgi:hypothetical protein
MTICCEAALRFLNMHVSCQQGLHKYCANKYELLYKHYASFKTVRTVQIKESQKGPTDFNLYRNTYLIIVCFLSAFSLLPILILYSSITRSRLKAIQLCRHYKDE